MATQNGAGGHVHERLSRPLDLAAEPRLLMTLRVSRDAGRTWSQTTRVQSGDPYVILSDPGRYPPCECPRCLGSSPVSARAQRPAETEPGAA